MDMAEFILVIVGAFSSCLVGYMEAEGTGWLLPAGCSCWRYIDPTECHA
jgi:hypothetical protein